MALTDLIFIFVIIAVISGFFHWISALVITDGGTGKMPLFFNPFDLYVYTKLNWVGVILVYLLCFVLCPIFVIGGLLKRN